MVRGETSISSRDHNKKIIKGKKGTKKEKHNNQLKPDPVHIKKVIKSFQARKKAETKIRKKKLS